MRPLSLLLSYAQDTLNKLFLLLLLRGLGLGFLPLTQASEEQLRSRGMQEVNEVFAVDRPCGQELYRHLLRGEADLAGPGVGDYNELESILPRDYNPLLTAKETQKAIFHLRRYIEDNLCKEPGLMMVQVLLIVDVERGVNDMLDRDDSRTPIRFHISNDRDKPPIDTRWCKQPPSGNASP